LGTVEFSDSLGRNAADACEISTGIELLTVGRNRQRADDPIGSQAADISRPT
jgi:hypothetical protein